MKYKLEVLKIIINNRIKTSFTFYIFYISNKMATHHLTYLNGDDKYQLLEGGETSKDDDQKDQEPKKELPLNATACEGFWMIVK